VSANYSQPEITRAIKQAGGVEKFLLYIVKQTNKQTPVRLDDDFEMVMATSPTPNSIGYNTRMKRHEPRHIKNKETLKHSFFKRSLNVICTSPVSSTLVEKYGVSYKYNVFSMTGEHVFNYEINKKDCQRRN